MVSPDEREFWAMTRTVPQGDYWPATPGDLPPGFTAPTLPAEMVPMVLREWLVELAARACFSLEFVTVPALIGAGAVVGRSVGIMPSQFDDYLVVPNLWGAVIARPGLMKSYAISEGLRPVLRLAAVARERFEAEAPAREARLVRLNAELDAVKSRMTQAAKKTSDEPEDLEQSYALTRQEIAAAQLSERRYVTHDTTVEALDRLLIENPRGLLQLRDELAGWVATLSKPGRESEREYYLEAWNGTGSFTRDRVGRGTIHIPAVTLAVFGGIQPGKLKPLVDGAITGRQLDDGLIQRFQLAVWPDDFGTWKPAESWMDPKLKEEAFMAFSRLDQLGELMTVAAKVGKNVYLDDNGIPYLRFAPDAQDFFTVWRSHLEHRLRSKELASTPSFEGHIAKYRSLMPSLALLFHLLSGDQADKPPSPVSLDAALLAADWCEFLEQHAHKMYAAELTPGAEGAQVLAARIRAGAVLDGESVRDLARHHWAGLGTAGEVRNALSVLEGVHWLRVTAEETGGRPSEIIRLHPSFRRPRNA